MEEEIKENTQVEDTTTDYIEAITQLKKNSVDRSEYDKLRAENKKLIDAVVNGQPGQEEPAESKHSKEQIDVRRKRFVGGNPNAYHFAESIFRRRRNFFDCCIARIDAHAQLVGDAPYGYGPLYGNICAARR